MIEAPVAAVPTVHRRSTSSTSVAVVLLGAFLATVLIRTAWVADGAFVDLRTVANVITGHGLRWNVDERVQAFSDPLWVLLLSLVSLLIHQPYAVVLAVSIFLTLFTAAVLSSRIAVNPFAALIALAILTFSRSFIEYATAGFQTPLVYVLVATFWAAYLDRSSGDQTRRLMLLASLCALTDWSALLAIGPGLVAALHETRPRGRDLAVAVAPVAAWVLFAAWYYGAVIPPPIVAAWHAIGPLPAMFKQGIAYLLDAIDVDPLTVAAIGLAIIGGVRSRELRSLSIGLVLMLATVVFTGGDVMSGRALAVPVLLAAIAAARQPWDRLGVLFVPAVAGIVALGLIAPESPVLTGAGYHRETQPLSVPWPNMASAVVPARAAIRDERRNWYAVTGLLTMQRTRAMPDVTSMEREVEELAGKQTVVVDERIGLFAYAAGARLHIVDPDGRTDPVLARQSPVGEWKPGPRPRDLRSTYAAAIPQNR
jgi:arabinofuranosyltransferase